MRAYQKRRGTLNPALHRLMNPLSTRSAIREMLARGEIVRASRLSIFSDRIDAWADRHPILIALIAFPLFWALMIGIASL